METIRIPPGSNIYVAAMEIWDGEGFIVWLTENREVWRLIENGNGSEPGWIEIILCPLDDP